MRKIKLCILKEFPSLEEGIFELTGCSKSHLKKYKIAKKQLKQKIIPRSEIELPINLLNNGLISPIYTGKAVRVIKETNNILALSKPVKVHSHPLSYDEKDNVLSYLRSENYLEILKVNNENYDRGLLYRLDFETSGLLLCAKNLKTYKLVRESFHKVLKRKKYIAIAIGFVKNETNIVHHLTGSGPKQSLMEANLTRTSSSVEATINIKQLEYSKEEDLSLIEVELFQGHRHQIRTQLKAIGHAILGDPIYGSSPFENERMFLHCYSYLIEMEGEDHLFEDIIPDDFLKFFRSNG